MSTRLRIEQVHCAVDGLVTVGRVELSHHSRTASGLASARTTDNVWQQVVAEATLSAMRVFMDGRLDLTLDAVAEVRSGPQPLIVVTMIIGRGKNEIFASGAAPMIEDRFTAVARAVLHGLNRWVEPSLADADTNGTTAHAASASPGSRN
jgi:hypothetical protein